MLEVKLFSEDGSIEDKEISIRDLNELLWDIEAIFNHGNPGCAYIDKIEIDYLERNLQRRIAIKDWEKTKWNINK